MLAYQYLEFGPENVSLDNITIDCGNDW